MSKFCRGRETKDRGCRTESKAGCDSRETDNGRGSWKRRNSCEEKHFLENPLNLCHSQLALLQLLLNLFLLQQLPLHQQHQLLESMCQDFSVTKVRVKGQQLPLLSLIGGEGRMNVLPNQVAVIGGQVRTADHPLVVQGCHLHLPLPGRGHGISAECFVGLEMSSVSTVAEWLNENLLKEHG